MSRKHITNLLTITVEDSSKPITFPSLRRISSPRYYLSSSDNYDVYPIFAMDEYGINTLLKRKSPNTIGRNIVFLEDTVQSSKRTKILYTFGH